MKRFEVLIVLVLLLCLAFVPQLRAQDSVTAAVSSNTAAAQLLSDEQVSAALDNVGVKASTDIASVELPYLGLTDVTTFVKKTRLGTMWDSKGRNWALAYVPLQTPLSDWTYEVSDLTAGFAYRVNDKNGAAVAGIGVRGDKLTELCSGGAWTIPAVEVQGGYALIAQSGEKPAGVWYAGIAYGFGGKK